jgi:hypothetical protein
MKSNSKKAILWSLVFALAIIASAFLFKGHPALYWIDAALTVAALTLVVLRHAPPQQPAHDEPNRIKHPMKLRHLPNIDKRL